jgi:hypothetical protein
MPARSDACPLRSRRRSSNSSGAYSGSRRSSLGRGARRGPRRMTSPRTRRAALLQLDPLWSELFPAEQARVVQVLVDPVDLHGEGFDVHLPDERHRRARVRSREEGRMTEEDRPVTMRIPLVFQKQGGRKTVITPDGNAWSRPHRSSIAPWSGAGAGVPLAADARHTASAGRSRSWLVRRRSLGGT